jgi:hypothetical protein
VQASRFVLAAVFGFAALPLHCKKPESAASDERAACASACAALVSAGCERQGLRTEDQVRCVDECTKRGVELAPAHCGDQRAAYLTCVARAAPDCARLDCSAANCLEHATGLESCRAQHSSWRACVAPCLDPGSTHVGERVVRGDTGDAKVGAELVRAGCGECPTPKPGAPPGSPCTAASVCGQVCCKCPKGPASYLARACVDASCRAGNEACELTRRALSDDPCPQ